ncbi:hypothetical protein GKIL_3763 [Gloeobacter kilaueensis JS1]|uniref:Uncharacterized protein n=1 Tax=Gloeobacter kilaueensis (strain ATCC BAA-2537 / CCAP 1431/1 / ULC 316 / JS1) TaxID=1183438 RepID=U5QQU5_GLOK1|nr:hypothetical protein GKIL_3763 [Gloeobacter kilaueensis JS1]
MQEEAPTLLGLAFFMGTYLLVRLDKLSGFSLQA